MAVTLSLSEHALGYSAEITSKKFNFFMANGMLQRKVGGWGWGCGQKETRGHSYDHESTV